MQADAHWLAATEVYLDQLDSILNRVDVSLEGLRTQTIEAGPAKIEPTLLELAEALSDLERHVVRREDLLKDPRAPKAGYTLIEKLTTLASQSASNASTLLQRAVANSHRMEHLSQRSLSQYVCQYHLSELTADIVRQLCGQTDTPTYGSQVAPENRPRSGGIFNRAG